MCSSDLAERRQDQKIRKDQQNRRKQEEPFRGKRRAPVKKDGGGKRPKNEENHGDGKAIPIVGIPMKKDMRRASSVPILKDLDFQRSLRVCVRNIKNILNIREITAF